jgi:hypothetical protein
MADSSWQGQARFPVEVLQSLSMAVRRGPVLYLGPDTSRVELFTFDGEHADAVVFSPRAVVTLRKEGAGIDVRGWPKDPGALEVPGGRYELVVMDGVLNALAPHEGDRVLSAVRRAACHGGLVLASALTTDAQLDAEGPSGGGRPLRLLLPGELSMAFAGWSLLYAVEKPLGADIGSAATGRAVVVARRPSGGTLLA